MRRGVSAPELLQSPNNFSVEQSDLFCGPEHSEAGVFIFMLILSSWENTEKRDHIRKTWATYNWFKDQPALTYSYKFLISRQDPGKEYKQHPTDLNHPDIYMADLNEHYYLLDIKVMWGFNKALSDHKFKYLLKCDDDSFVNLWRLPPKLMARATTEYFYGGKQLETFHWSETPIFYASGSGYVLSRKAVCAVVFAHSVYSLETPRIPIEDVYTGLLASKMGIKLTQLAGFASEHESCKDFHTVIFHHINMKLFKNLLKSAVNGTHFC